MPNPRPKNDPDPAKSPPQGRLDPAPKPQHLQHGQAAERMAADFLQQRGLRVLHRNVRVRGGEIDLIALEASTLVFVEVRLRRQGGQVSAAESITPTKQARLIVAASTFLQQHPEHGTRACRFDVLAFAALDAEPEWICGAFTA